MKVNKKAVFMLGACYGAFVTISGVIAAKVFNKVLDDKIDKKVGTKCSNNLCYPHNSYSSPFGFASEDNDFGNSSFGEDDNFFGNSSFDNAENFKCNSTFENTSKNDPDTIFFESED